MKIIAGLGNPGEKYAKTRHNVGFMVVDKLCDKLKSEWKEEKRFIALVANCTQDGEKLLLVKPLTMMNLSGQTVSKIVNFYKESPGNLTIIYDDLDLPLGTVRIRDKGSAGTHNGMKSIILSLGTEEFKRIRLGTESRGLTSPGQQDTTSYVLSSFTKEEEPIIKKVIEEVVGDLS